MRKKGQTAFGSAVIASLTEFLNSARNGLPMTARTVKLNLEPTEYDKEDVKAVRATLGVSQAVFAQLLAVSVKTVQAWEAGVSPVSPIARRLLDDIKVDPQSWMRRQFERSATTTPARRRKQLA